MDNKINKQLININGFYFVVQYIKEPLNNTYGKVEYNLIALISDKKIDEILTDGLVLIKYNNNIKVYNISTNQISDIIFENIIIPTFLWQYDNVYNFLSDCSSYTYKYVNKDEEIYKSKIEDIIKEILYIKFKELFLLK